METKPQTIPARLQGMWENRILPVCDLLSRRKASAFFFVFFVTSCFLAYGSFLMRIVPACLSLLLTGAVLVLFHNRRFWYRVLLPLLLGILCGSSMTLVLFSGYAAHYERLAEVSSVRSVRAVVTDVVYTNAYSGSYICRITGDGLPYSVVLASDSPDYRTGQILEGSIQLVPWEDVDDGFAEKEYYLARSVVSAANDLGILDTGETKFTLAGLFAEWNQSLSDTISAHVRNDGLPMAMLLGNRSELSDAVKRDFRRLGILHLLAVSGTHFSLLQNMAQRILIKLRIRPGHRSIVLFFGTILYMFLTGMSSSVQRAGLMHLLALLCQRFGKKMRYFSALNVACGLILLADPFAVLDMGLHLSYLAVCGCLLTIEMESRWTTYRNLWKPKRTADGRQVLLRGWRRWLSPRFLGQRALSMLLLNLVVTCLTIPLSWLYFGEFSLVSLFVNLFYIPAAGVLLALTLVYLLLYPLGILIVPMASLLSGFAAFLEWPASVISGIPHVSVSLLYPFIPVFLVPLSLSVLLLPLRKHKLRGLLGSVLLLCLMVGTIFLYEAALLPESTAVYRNDRVKDGFVIRSDGQVLLVDISDGSNNFTSQLLVEAKRFYATELGGYMLTHYHNRHVGTLDSLSDNWILRKLYLPVPLQDGSEEAEKEAAVFHSLCRIAEEKGIEIVLFDRETTFGHMTIETASRVYLSRSTHPITGIRLSVGGEELAYGSSSFPQGDEAVTDWMTSAEYLVFGAHNPVYKKTFALPRTEKPKAALWNGDSAVYSLNPLPFAGTDLFHRSRLQVRFPDTTE